MSIDTGIEIVIDLNGTHNLDQAEEEIGELQKTLREVVESLETLRSRVTVEQARRMTAQRLKERPSTHALASQLGAMAPGFGRGLSRGLPVDGRWRSKVL
jgi:flagellar biosynthesis chaperone FliJ